MATIFAPIVGRPGLVFNSALATVSLTTHLLTKLGQPERHSKHQQLKPHLQPNEG